MIRLLREKSVEKRQAREKKHQHRMTKIYNRYAPVYDEIFERLLTPGIRMALSNARFEKNCRILDLGIGTGVCLKYAPRNAEIIGLDISFNMLLQARSNARKNRINASLLVGNGETLPFVSNAFDAVFLFHVLSVIPDPEKALCEIHRVVKPEGRVVIVNSLLSRNPIFSAVQKALNPICLRLGWKNNFSLKTIRSLNRFEIETVEKKKRHVPWSIVNLRSV